MPTDATPHRVSPTAHPTVPATVAHAVPGAFTGQTARVLGGDPSAAATAARLQSAGAVVTVVAPEICPDMVDLVIERRVTWLRRESDDLDATAPGVVFGASDRPRRHPRPAPAHRPT